MRENKSDDLMTKEKKDQKRYVSIAVPKNSTALQSLLRARCRRTMFCPKFFQLKKPPLNLGVTSAHYIKLSSNEAKLELGDQVDEIRNICDFILWSCHMLCIQAMKV